MNPLVSTLKGRLIVSCQALAGNALRSSEAMALMARAAMQGGAAAIRANGVDDITAIRKKVIIPIIGLNKEAASPDIPYITPTFEHARAVVEAGADIIALDATARPRPGNVSAADLIRRVKNELHVPVMADIATFQEGIMAAEAGADLISTTLSGYTADSPRLPGPDLNLIKQLTAATSVPVVAEGRFHTPEELALAFHCGAFAAVIGKMITNPEFITKYFISRMNTAKVLPSEAVNPDTRDIDRKSTLEILTQINAADATVSGAVGSALADIADTIDRITERLRHGGRLFYIGAGTSGRLAVQDAAECPPTYGVSPDMIQAIMAGGPNAVFHPQEKMEDDCMEGGQILDEYGITSADAVLGISANGNAAFVGSALEAARKRGAFTAAMASNQPCLLSEAAEKFIYLPTGAEVICGSTRMKAGTAQKMVLNMISTTVMIKLGRVTGNFMTAMRPTNAKLKKRALFIITELTGVTPEKAEQILEMTDGDIQTAVRQLKELSTEQKEI
ncbi:MAG: N-acetylmuramic acid 6-phosphate etherase [Lentisphaeria bacterium]|nr:N-acetylmuramic acid 6-phosphate etherase [Lentisphaeria bacterium]